MKNVIVELYKFTQRCLVPAICPPDYLLCYMVQSGEYTFGADIISNWKKLDFEESRILLKIMFFPKLCTVAMIRRLCFNPASFIMKVIIYILLLLFCMINIIQLSIGYRDRAIRLVGEPKSENGKSRKPNMC